MRNWTYYYDRGIDLKTKGQLEESAEHHLKVFEVAPDLDMPEAWHNAGAALLRINKVAEAKPYLERALVEYDVCIDEKNKDDYYTFWKACVYALLNDKTKMLETLEICFDLNHLYTNDAKEEEDFVAYFEDEDFVGLIDKTIEKVLFRGETMSRGVTSSEQLKWRSVFVDNLEEKHWKKDKLFTDSFENAAVSPQAMFEFCDNVDFCFRLSLHLDTFLVFFELHHKKDVNDVLMLRLYLNEGEMEENVAKIISTIDDNKTSITAQTWPSLVKKLIPFCQELQLQQLDGTRLKLS